MYIRSVYNKAIEFWNLVDMYTPDVVIGMESWLKEDISSAEVLFTSQCAIQCSAVWCIDSMIW